MQFTLPDTAMRTMGDSRDEGEGWAAQVATALVASQPLPALAADRLQQAFSGASGVGASTLRCASGRLGAAAGGAGGAGETGAARRKIPCPSRPNAGPLTSSLHRAVLCWPRAAPMTGWRALS